MQEIYFILIGILLIGLHGISARAYRKKEDNQYREIRHEKEQFLANNKLEGVEIIKAEIKRISARPTKDYDLFTVLDANNEIYDIKVFDTNINGVFKTKKEG